MVTVVFFVATIVAFVGFVIADAPAVVVLGIVTAVICLDLFVQTARAVKAARRSGWRRQPLTANPYHPAWDGLHAVTAYHRRYVAPSQDMDAEARAVWTRAVDAVRRLRQSQVVRLGLVDAVQVMTVLPYHLWEVAERLARLSALRVSVLGKLFERQLDGHQLLGQVQRGTSAVWLNFRTVTNRRWHVGNIVLAGDAAHTTHYTIGSGTTLAIEDAIALADSLQQYHGEQELALESYERQRKAALLLPQSDAPVQCPMVREHFSHLPPTCSFACGVISWTGKPRRSLSSGSHPGGSWDHDI